MSSTRATMLTVDINTAHQENVVEAYLGVMKYITVFTTPIYLEAFYCTFYKSSKFQHHYRCALKFHIFLCLLEEVYGFQLMRPMIFLPIVGIYADGLLSALNVPVFAQVIGFFLIIQLNSSLLLHMVAFRLKIIVPVTWRLYDEACKIGRGFVIFFYFYSILIISSFLLLYEDQNEAKSYLLQNISPIPNVFWSENYVVSTTRSDSFFTFMLVFGLSLLTFAIICIILPITSFVILYRSRESLSHKVIEAQKSYLRTLLIQDVVVFLFIFLPLGVFYAGLSYSIINPAVIAISLILAISHGWVSVLVLLISTKPYMRVIRSQIEFVTRIVTCSKKAAKYTSKVDSMMPTDN